MTGAYRQRKVAQTIKSQIGIGALMSVGAHQFAYEVDPDGLTFKARLSLRGQTRVRVMRVSVLLMGSDTYEVRVTYADRGRFYTTKQTDVYAEDLPRTILDLDRFGVQKAPANQTKED